MNYTTAFLNEAKAIIDKISVDEIEEVANLLDSVKGSKGRIFFAGSGGGAGHSSHAAADFRKISGIESYSISDNVSELTARINDENWENAYVELLRGSQLKENDAVFIFSVGGGNAELNISMNLVNAAKYAIEIGANVIAIVGRDGGELRKIANSTILVPTVNEQNITTQVEGFQALLWHLLVCHPKLESNRPKWESENQKN